MEKAAWPRFKTAVETTMSSQQDAQRIFVQIQSKQPFKFHCAIGTVTMTFIASGGFGTVWKVLRPTSYNRGLRIGGSSENGSNITICVKIYDIGEFRSYSSGGNGNQ
jgi:hypothetical protein